MGCGNTIVSKGYKCHFCYKIYSRAFKLSNHFRKMHSHENELFQDVPGVKKPRLKYVMGDDGYYKLNDYGFQLQRPKKIDLESKMVILTKGSREIDVHDIDDVIINHEPTTYDTKKQIFSCRYCNHMYQSPIWLAQHENECDLRADSEFKKIMHPTVNTIPTEESEIPTSNFSPENDSEIELEPSSPMFYMPTHNHIDAYQTNHPENQYNNNDHQIYPHQ